MSAEERGMAEDAYAVTIVKYGERATRKSDVYLNHHITGQPDDPIGMDYFVWVLRGAGRTIVVDTGFSRHGGDVRRRTFVIDPAEAFAALGVATGFDVPTDAAPTVVVTHAHYDHIGNLGLFPRSEIVIAESELAFWTGPLARRAQFHHSVEDDELSALAAAAAEGRVRTFRGSLELAPGIEVLEVGGHTPGQSIVLVQTTDGPALLASDSMHYYEELEEDMPFAFVADLPAMYSGFDTIRALLDSGRAEHLVSGHDPSTLSRFAPVTSGPLAGIAATIGAAAHTTSTAKEQQ